MLQELPLQVLVSVLTYIDNPLEVLLGNKKLYKTRSAFARIKNGHWIRSSSIPSVRSFIPPTLPYLPPNYPLKGTDFLKLLASPHTLFNALTTLEFDLCLTYSSHLLTLPKPLENIKSLLSRIHKQYHTKILQNLVYTAARTGSLIIKDLSTLGHLQIPFQILSQLQLLSLIPSESEEIMETILTNDFDTCLEKMDKYEQVHLHQAVLANSFKCVKVLLKYLKPTQVCIDDAVINGYTRIVYLMIKAGVNPQEVLYKALESDKVGIIQMLCALNLVQVDPKALAMALRRETGMRCNGKTALEYLSERCDVLKVLGVSREAFGVLCKVVAS